jgi:hypothetical protein
MIITEKLTIIYFQNKDENTVAGLIILFKKMIFQFIIFKYFKQEILIKSGIKI